MVIIINGHREEKHTNDVDVRIMARGAIVSGYADANRYADKIGGFVVPAGNPFDLDNDEWEVIGSR